MHVQHSTGELSPSQSFELRHVLLRVHYVSTYVLEGLAPTLLFICIYPDRH
jgi:hypothetical protein